MLHDVETGSRGEFDGEGRLRVIGRRHPHGTAVVVHRESGRESVLLGGEAGQRIHRVDLVDRHGNRSRDIPLRRGAGRRLGRVGHGAVHQAVGVEFHPVHADAAAARRIGQHDGVELPPFPVRGLHDGAVGRPRHEALRLAEQRVVGRVAVGAERRSRRVVPFGVGLPLRAGSGVFEIIDAVPFDDPRTFDPGHAGVFVHLAVALPRVHGVESEEVGGLPGEARQVLRIEAHAVDAADAAAGPEEVRLVVVVDEDLRVEAPVPAVFDRAGVLEETEVGVGAERVVGHEDVVAVAGQVEPAVVLDQVRSHGNVLHGVEFPVQEVVGDPHAAAGAAHVIPASFFQHGDVTAGIAARADGHRKRVAIALAINKAACRQGGDGC